MAPEREKKRAEASVAPVWWWWRNRSCLSDPAQAAASSPIGKAQLFPFSEFFSNPSSLCPPALSSFPNPMLLRSQKRKKKSYASPPPSKPSSRALPASI